MNISKGTSHEHLPERTLFGSNMDSSKFMSNIDYSTFLSGEWSSQQKEKSQRNNTFLADRTQLNNVTDENKADFLKVNYNAPSNSLKANQIQSNDYNSFRRAKSSYHINNSIDTSRYNNKQDKSNHHKDIFVSNNSTTNRPILQKINPNNYADTETYKSADGTLFNRFKDNNNNTNYLIIDYPSKNVIHIPGKYHELYRTTLKTDEVPDNIKGKFGSKLTDQLLNDQLKVHDTLSFIQNSGISRKVDKSSDFVDGVDNTTQKSIQTNRSSSNMSRTNKNNDYYDLGNSLRHAVCHGYPKISWQSLNKAVYTDQVSQEHFTENKNIESPYRRKKDWLGNWTDKNNLNEKQKKELDLFAKTREKKFLFLTSSPPAHRVEEKTNNNHNNRKEAPNDKISQTKLKTPTKNKNDNKITKPNKLLSNKKNFENDFVFEEPPPSPSYPNVDVQPAAKIDQEFWKFYDSNA